MEDRKRRSSPLGDGSDGHAAQKRKLSSLSGSQPGNAPAEEEHNGAQLDAALGLEDGFLEVSFSTTEDDSRSISKHCTPI